MSDLITILIVGFAIICVELWHATRALYLIAQVLASMYEADNARAYEALGNRTNAAA